MTALRMLGCAVVAFLIGTALGYIGGHRSASLAIGAKLAEERTERTKEIAGLERELRDAHIESAKTITDILDKNAKDTERLVADFNGDKLRLRKSLICPKLPATDGAASGIDGPSQGGFQREDGNFLIRFSGGCDAVAEQLTELQNYVDHHNSIMKKASN